jgi:hypothetical protein
MSKLVAKTIIKSKVANFYVKKPVFADNQEEGLYKTEPYLAIYRIISTAHGKIIYLN